MPHRIASQVAFSHREEDRAGDAPAPKGLGVLQNVDSLRSLIGFMGFRGDFVVPMTCNQMYGSRWKTALARM